MAISSDMRRLPLMLLAASGSLASPAIQPRQEPETTTANLLGYPPYNAGFYTFVSCNAQQGPALVDLFTRTADVITKQIMPALETPPQDPTHDPFPVFFGDNPRDWINGTFTSVLGQRPWNQDSPTTSWRPRVICLNNGDVPELARASQVCSQGIKPVSFTEDSGGNTVIYLCPAFFDDLPAFPTKGGANCPTVNANANSTKFSAHNDAVQNQFGAMIHELTHAALYEAQSPSNHYDEAYPLNDIVALPAVQQFWNANNYAYYASCIYSGCTTFPPRPTAPPRQKRMTRLLRKKRQTDADADADADAVVPAIIDDYPYPTGLDTAALAKNLTALGYEDEPATEQDFLPLQFGGPRWAGGDAGSTGVGAG